jgi:hypothetical protein
MIDEHMPRQMKHHLLIAGTGRAGTSLLVRFLNELGLETHIAVHQDGSGWDDNANAGLEDKLLRGGAAPYVVKSPWLFQSIDEVLLSQDIAIDGVIVPVRDLSEAASSRTILELQNIHRSQEWFSEEAAPWKAWGSTPGGMLYSLDPLDQARLLAVGFHHLVERLVTAEVPVFLLAFPKFTEDPLYLYRCLKACLPANVTEQDAIAAHGRIVDPGKVRVTKELSAKHVYMKSPENIPSLEKMDNIALRREIARLRTERPPVVTIDREDEIRSLEALADDQNRQIASISSALDECRAQLRAILQSKSWRITHPLRRLMRSFGKE